MAHECLMSVQSCIKTQDVEWEENFIRQGEDRREGDGGQSGRRKSKGGMFGMGWGQ